MSFELVVTVVAGVGVGWILKDLLHDRGGPPREELREEDGHEPEAPPAEEPEPELPPDTERLARLYALRAHARAAYDDAAQPDDLLADPRFAALAQWLRDGPFDEPALIRYYDGACTAIASAAIVALAQRTPSERALDDVLREVHDCDFFTRHFALRLLRERSLERALPGLFRHLDASWRHSWGRRVLRDHLEACFAAIDEAAGTVGHGDPDSPVTDLDGLAALVHQSHDLEAEFVAELVADLGDRGAALARAIRGPQADTDSDRSAAAADGSPQEPGVQFLRSFARVLTPTAAGDGPIVDATTDAQARAIASVLAGGRSAVVVGEAGAGKTAAIRALADRHLAAGGIAFVAGAMELMAGQKYIGQVEERLRLLIETFGRLGRKLLWIVPDFHELAWAGRHDNNPTSILDHVLPHIDDGTLVVVGEVRTAEWERTTQLQPTAKSVLETVKIAARGDDDALALARAWHARGGTGAPALGDAELREALHLARHHLDDTALPGSLLRLLDHAIRHRGDDRREPLDRGDLLLAVGALTGLPRDVLDDRTRLDLDALRAFFETRVLGQPEAIDTLVERVAMIKAGLTDPTRPQGAFLFTGPTGTGKTEIAKTLAAWMFGSPDRMIRLDMSELQDAGGLNRILGEGGAHDASQSLAQRVRQQPFSVILLDELEKAHPAVWDLFLQILDDGRLTDRRGRLADFRHAIVIMTSNVGAQRAHGANLGFGGAAAQGAALQELKQTFRSEFLNRIDRIVVFRPLTEATMRKVLEKELHLALERRGLRSRQWAVEWDGTALDFLLREGFSAELGARPLRRAIEHHLLAPLAKTIVRHEAPAGDQFLFVRSDGRRIEVQFVDPDAPEGGELPEVVREGGPLDVVAIALDATGSVEEAALLQQKIREIEALVAAPPWQQRKSHALDATAEPGFWTSPDRFAVLGTAEYVDRIQTGLDTAVRLLGRLRGGHGTRSRYDPGMLRQLAQRVFLLERAIADVEAGAPNEAFVLVESVPDTAHGGGDPSEFAARVLAMYASWGRARGMTVQAIEHRAATGDQPFRALLAVAGFGAWSLLATEHGLHVLEADGPRHHETDRRRVRVSVAPQPIEPPQPDTPRGRRTQAQQALDARGVGPDIVRRYRELPSPLVRDAVRGWRTGRLDRVLAGDFDLIR